jgi:hypothetical protein
MDSPDRLLLGAARDYSTLIEAGMLEEAHKARERLFSYALIYSDWVERGEATRERHGGLAAIAGKWPGDESDEQVAAAVKALGIEGCADGPCPPGRCLYQEGVDLRRRRPEVFQDHDEEVRRSYREADKRVRGDTTRERLRRLIEARKPDPDCPSCRGSGRQPYYDGLPCDVCGGDIREGEEQ